MHWRAHIRNREGSNKMIWFTKDLVLLVIAFTLVYILYDCFLVNKVDIILSDEHEMPTTEAAVFGKENMQILSEDKGSLKKVLISHAVTKKSTNSEGDAIKKEGPCANYQFECAKQKLHDKVLESKSDPEKPMGNGKFFPSQYVIFKKDGKGAVTTENPATEKSTIHDDSTVESFQLENDNAVVEDDIVWGEFSSDEKTQLKNSTFTLLMMNSELLTVETSNDTTEHCSDIQIVTSSYGYNDIDKNKLDDKNYHFKLPEELKGDKTLNTTTVIILVKGNISQHTVCPINVCLKYNKTHEATIYLIWIMEPSKIVSVDRNETKDKTCLFIEIVGGEKDAGKDKNSKEMHVTVYIDEEVPTGTKIDVPYPIAITRSAHLYVLSDESGYFGIDNFTGQLIAQKRLDYEEIKKIEKKIMIFDPVFETSENNDPVFPLRIYEPIHMKVSVQLTDINDNAPVFENGSYQVKVIMVNNNEIKLDTPLFQVVAKDIDSGLNGKIRFKLAHQDGANLLKINPTTGNMFLRTPVESLPQEVRVAVEARDRNGKGQNKALLYVDVVFVEDEENSTMRKNVTFSIAKEKCDKFSKKFVECLIKTQYTVIGKPKHTKEFEEYNNKLKIDSEMILVTTTAINNIVTPFEMKNKNDFPIYRVTSVSFKYTDVHGQQVCKVLPTSLFSMSYDGNLIMHPSLAEYSYGVFTVDTEEISREPPYRRNSKILMVWVCDENDMHEVIISKDCKEFTDQYKDTFVSAVRQLSNFYVIPEQDDKFISLEGFNRPDWCLASYFFVEKTTHKLADAKDVIKMYEDHRETFKFLHVEAILPKQLFNHLYNDEMFAYNAVSWMYSHLPSFILYAMVACGFVALLIIPASLCLLIYHMRIAYKYRINVDTTSTAQFEGDGHMLEESDIEPDCVPFGIVQTMEIATCEEKEETKALLLDDEE